MDGDFDIELPDAGGAQEASKPVQAEVPSPERLTQIAQPIAEAIAKNCNVPPQLVFPHLFLGLRDLFTTQPPALPAAPTVPMPIGFMSEQQLPLIEDQDGEGGRYIPMRKTPAGNFTLALYTAPTVQASGERVSLPRQLVIELAALLGPEQHERRDMLRAALASPPASVSAPVQQEQGEIRCDGCGKTIAQHDRLLRCGPLWTRVAIRAARTRGEGSGT